MLHIRLGLTGGGPAESCGKPPIGSRGRPPTCNTPRTARKEPDRPEAPPAKNPTREGYSGASEWDWWGSWGDPGRGRVQICHKGAPGRDRSRRKPRNINDSSCAPRLDWGLCGRFGHGPGPDRVRLVPRDPRTPSVSGSASRRPSRGRTWRPGRIVPGRTRLRGRQNRAIMRKPTDTPGAGARTILPGRQNRVRALGPARPRPRHGAPVQQIRTHPAPQTPYTPPRHTQNNLPGVTVPGVTGRQARGAEPQAEVMTVGRGHMSAGRGHGGEWSGPASSPWRPGTRSGVMAALGTTPTGSGAARIGPR